MLHSLTFSSLNRSLTLQVSTRLLRGCKMPVTPYLPSSLPSLLALLSDNGQFRLGPTALESKLQRGQYTRTHLRAVPQHFSSPRGLRAVPCATLFFANSWRRATPGIATLFLRHRRSIFLDFTRTIAAGHGTLLSWPSTLTHQMICCARQALHMYNHAIARALKRFHHRSLSQTPPPPRLCFPFRHQQRPQPPPGLRAPLL